MPEYKTIWFEGKRHKVDDNSNDLGVLK
jgi:hypothetical protein